MKYIYPMNVRFTTTGTEYTASINADGAHVDFQVIGSKSQYTYQKSHSITAFEALFLTGLVEFITPKIEPITLQVQIEGLEKAVALAKELEAVLGRLKIVVN